MVVALNKLGAVVDAGAAVVVGAWLLNKDGCAGAEAGVGFVMGAADPKREEAGFGAGAAAVAGVAVVAGNGSGHPENNPVIGC